MRDDDSPSRRIEHAYPLKQITIKLYRTRHSNKFEVGTARVGKTRLHEDLISLLNLVRGRLEQGCEHGKADDDDFGYVFSIDLTALDSIFDDSAPIFRDRRGNLIPTSEVFQTSDQTTSKTIFAASGAVYLNGSQSKEFTAFIARLGEIVADEGINLEVVADAPIGDSINLSFAPDQELIIDRIVRRARIDLLRHNNIDQGAWREEGFTFEIKKSFIVQPGCWSLSFSFAERYRLVENSQP